MEMFESELQKIETRLKEILARQGEFSMPDAIFGKLDIDLPCAHLDSLYLPVKNLVECGGKRWRPLFALLLFKELGGKNEKLAIDLACAVEFFHNASLIHDDIEDNASMRRGKQAAHLRFGVDSALNSGSWCYFLALSLISNADCDESARLAALKTANAEMTRLHLGQAMDIFWHRNPNIFPSRAEYLQMTRLKTGCAAALAAKFACIAAADKKSMEFWNDVALDFGVAFQAADDAANLQTGNAGKHRGDDIVEGKKSLPVILHLEKNPSDKEKILHFFENARVEGIESAAVQHCIDLLKKSDSIKSAADFARKAKSTVLQKISQSESVAALFNSLCE